MRDGARGLEGGVWPPGGGGFGQPICPGIYGLLADGTSTRDNRQRGTVRPASAGRQMDASSARSTAMNPSGAVFGLGTPMAARAEAGLLVSDGEVHCANSPALHGDIPFTDASKDGYVPILTSQTLILNANASVFIPRASIVNDFLATNLDDTA